MIEAFFHGFILAFGLILPLGVQNIFIFNQGANQPSFFRSIPAVISASLCDTLLIFLAVQGVSLLVLNFIWVKTILFSIGFLFLIFMGYITWQDSADTNNKKATGALSAKKQIIFAASVSLLNPHAMMDTIGVIGTSSMAYTGNEKWVFTFATILVSWVWFIGLAIAGRILGQLDQSETLLKLFNKVSAVIIWGSALYILASLIGIK